MDYNEDWRGLCWQQGMFHLDLIFSVCQSTHSWASSEIWSRHCTGALRVVAGIHGGREELDTTERLHFHFFFSCIGEGNGNPFQCSCLENPRDRGAGWAAVYGVTQSRTRLKRLSSSTHLSLSLHLCNTSVPATVLIQGWYRADTGIQGLLRPVFLPLGSPESREGGGQTDYYFIAVGAMIKGSMKCSGRIHIVVELLSRIRLCDPMECSMRCLPVLHYFLSLLKLTSIELVMPSSHLIFGHPLLLLPSIFPKISFFSSEPALGIRWPKYWPLQHQSF